MISIITPVLNEESMIDSFLPALAALGGDWELILVDGGSSDGTVDRICAHRPQFPRSLTLIRAPRGRASQMNAGAGIASGVILLFLHADCSIPPDSVKAIEEACTAPGVAGGGFTQAFPGGDPLVRLICVLGNFRVRVTRNFYGDSGIFVKNDIFRKTGGYDPVPFFEDVLLCRDAKKMGRLVVLDRVILTSPRRFLEKGPLRLTFVYGMAIIFHLFGLRPRWLEPVIVER
jgi:rSAM/selenodomain-associated transferase 2